MNERRREQLRSVVVELESARSIVDAVCDKEQDCMDNYPENFQYTEQFERTETAVDSLERRAGKAGRSTGTYPARD